MLPEAAGGAEAARQFFASGGGLVGAAAGASGAVAGEQAANAVPEEYKPLVDMLTNMGVGGLVAAGSAALQGAGRAVASGWNRLRAPLPNGKNETVINPETGQPFTTTDTGTPIAGTPGQWNLGLGRVAGAAGVPPSELGGTIPAQNPNMPGTLSLGQSTGNLGTMRLERTLRTANNAPFIAAEAANNQARAAALMGLAGPEEASAAASDFFLRRLHEIEATTPEEVAALASSRANAETLPITPASAAGAGMRGAIAEAHAPTLAGSDAAIRQATEAAEAGTTALGGGPETRLQDVGGAIQKPLTDLEAAKKARVDQLADAVDPEGKLAVDFGPLKSRASLIEKSGSKFDRRPDGETQEILNLIKDSENVEKFSDLRKLRTRITDELRVQRGSTGNPTNVRYLSMLLDSVDQAMAVSVGDAAAADAASVAAGTKGPLESVGGRMAAASPSA